MQGRWQLSLPDRRVAEGEARALWNYRLNVGPSVRSYFIVCKSPEVRSVFVDREDRWLPRPRGRVVCTPGTRREWGSPSARQCGLARLRWVFSG